jgi:hypothetical protein
VIRPARPTLAEVPLPDLSFGAERRPTISPTAQTTFLQASWFLAMLSTRFKYQAEKKGNDDGREANLILGR